MISKDKGVKRRTWKGRSKNGCKLCRARHVKCDEGNPCQNCIQVGKVCPGPGPRERRTGKESVSDYSSLDPADMKISKSISPGSKRDHLEGQLFYGFISERGNSMLGYHDNGFWDAIVAIGQEHDQLFTGVLAVATLYGMPMAETMDTELLAKSVSITTKRRYQNAQEWYFQSVKASLRSISPTALTSSKNHSVTEVTLLMLTSVLYIWIELRQANYENLDRLVVTTFAVICSAEEALVKTKGLAVLTALVRLLDFCFVTSANVVKVPRLHWESACRIAKSLVADLDPPPVTGIQIQLYEVYYDLEVMISHAELNHLETPIPGIDDSTIEIRLIECRQALKDLSSNSALRPLPYMHLMRLQILCLICDIHWQCCKSWPITPSGDAFQQQISQFLSFYEGFATFGTSNRQGFRSVMPLYILEASFAPCCLWAAWHWRNESVLLRCTTLLNHFKTYNQDNFLAAMLEYIETITGSDTATAIEVDLFGRKPTELLYWQAYLCVRRLLATSNQLIEPPAPMDVSLSPSSEPRQSGSMSSELANITLPP